MSLISLVVRRPVAVCMIAIAAAVFGLVSYLRLPLNLMPDLAYPTITVRTEVPGYAPQEVESQISRPIEEALATVQGLVELESRSRAGMSDVVLQFNWGADMDRATQSIRERLQTTFLPDEAQRPLILRYDPSLDPILRVALSTQGEGAPHGDQALFLLRDLAERQLKRELEAMDGVAAVRVRGGLEREVVVEVREDWLAARGVTIDQVIATIGSENVNLPGGSIREGDNEYLVRTLNEVRRVDEIEDLEIRRGDGLRVPLNEVAVVRETHKDREVVSHLDGREAVELEVYKAADANVVRVAQDLKKRLGLTPLPPGMPSVGIKDRLPAWVSMVVLEDQAAFVEAALNNLRSTGILGGILAVVVLFLFLRDFRATTIIATAIPLSIIVTFALMYVGSVSLNLMSLGGLALGIGMLVDNAVVVLENIHVQREEGLDRVEASVRGTAEMAAAVTASTLTTICVFLPVTFVEGIAGQVFGDLSLTVVFSLVASLIVALFFVPMLAALQFTLPADEQAFRELGRAVRFQSVGQFKVAWRASGRTGRVMKLPYRVLRLFVRLSFEILATLTLFLVGTGLRATLWGLGKVLPLVAGVALWGSDVFHAVYDRLADRYGVSIGPMMRRPGMVLGLAAVAVAGALALGGQLGQTLIPEVHQGRFTAELALPVGTPLNRTVSVVKPAEDAVKALGEVEHLHSVIGTEQRADSRPDEGEHTARLLVQLTPGGDLAAREAAAEEEVRQVLEQVREEHDLGEDLGLRLTRPSLFSFQTPIEVVLYSNDLDLLRDRADEVAHAMSRLGGLADVRSSLVDGYPEVRLTYRRELLSRYNLDTATVADRVREKVQGQKATTLSRADGRIDLTVRLAEGDRRSVEDLSRLNVNPAVNPPIPLSAVADFEEGRGPSEIRRLDQRRAGVVTASFAGGFDLSGRADAIAEAVESLDLGAVEWEIAGQNREMARSMSSMQLALALAIFLVYVIMASTFESFLHPFVILFSVPLAVVGVMVTLWVLDVPVSVVVLIGAIVLAGVVVNNAIVLVDTINRQRLNGAGRDDAIVRAARLRLRPILITTMTTVLGLLPLALGVGEGAEIQGPLAITVIAGLVSSTLLTLVVVPVVYRLVSREEQAA